MMNPLISPVFLSVDRIQIPYFFDVVKMQDEVKKIAFKTFLYYDVIPLRSPAHLVDPSIPQPPPAKDYADGSWTDWMDVPVLTESPYLTSIVNFFREKSKVTLVRLLRLEGGAVVKEHRDPTLGLQIEKSVIRLTIPIISNNEVEFYLNEEIVPMQPGECWYLRLTDPHRIVNRGAGERINMTIDMIPNAWVKDTIYQAWLDSKSQQP